MPLWNLYYFPKSRLTLMCKTCANQTESRCSFISFEPLWDSASYKWIVFLNSRGAQQILCILYISTDVKNTLTTFMCHFLRNNVKQASDRVAKTYVTVTWQNEFSKVIRLRTNISFSCCTKSYFLLLPGPCFSFSLSSKATCNLLYTVPVHVNHCCITIYHKIDLFSCKHTVGFLGKLSSEGSCNMHCNLRL